MHLLHVFRKAKDVISRLVTKFRGGGGAIGGGGSTTGSDEGSGMIELLVPGGKVGLIIGKGGETIKQLMVTIYFVSIDKIFVLFIYSAVSITENNVELLRCVLGMTLNSSHRFPGHKC